MWPWFFLHINWPIIVVLPFHISSLGSIILFLWVLISSRISLTAVWPMSVCAARPTIFHFTMTFSTFHWFTVEIRRQGLNKPVPRSIVSVVISPLIIIPISTVWSSLSAIFSVAVYLATVRSTAVGAVKRAYTGGSCQACMVQSIMIPVRVSVNIGVLLSIAVYRQFRFNFSCMVMLSIFIMGRCECKSL